MTLTSTADAGRPRVDKLEATGPAEAASRSPHGGGISAGIKESVMRKLVFSLLVLAIVAAPVAVSAQVGSGSVAASATIGNFSTVTQLRALSFGTVSRAAATTVAATNPAVNGAARLVYNFAATITITPPTLTSAGITLPMTLTCAQSADDATYAAVAGCTYGTLGLPAAQSSLYLGFGGSIDNADVVTRPAGLYSGDVTITIAP